MVVLILHELLFHIRQTPSVLIFLLFLLGLLARLRNFSSSDFLICPFNTLRYDIWAFEVHISQSLRGHF